MGKAKYCEIIDTLHLDKGSFIEDISKEVEFHHVIRDKNNDIHFLTVYTNARHFKASLFDIVPKEIIKMNQKDLKPLIVGYCKECEKDDKVPFLPYYLKQLILNFYPVFI